MLNSLTFNLHLQFAFTDVECGGGFYVRSLVDDLAKGSTLKIFISCNIVILT